MIGQWIRIGLTVRSNPIRWHRVKDAAEVKGDVERRWRLEFRCQMVAVANPTTLERGMPGAGAVICTVCAQAKDVG